MRKAGVERTRWDSAINGVRQLGDTSSPKIHPGERGCFNCKEEKLDQPGGLLLVGDVKWHRADDLPILVEHAGVDPAAVGAARGPALGGVTLGARVEATQAVFIEAITQVQ